jgi:hypothetical protein
MELSGVQIMITWQVKKVTFAKILRYACYGEAYLWRAKIERYV